MNAITTPTASRTVSTTGTSSTSDFLAVVAASDEMVLVFEVDGRTLVRPGYHVTEIRSMTVEAMDCGDRSDSWRETVVQLWNPGSEADREFMPTAKFLSIYRRVAASVPVRDDAELKIEYGDGRRPAVQYHVAALRQEADRLVVELSEPAVECKPHGGTAGHSCCAPSEPVELAVVKAGGCC